MTQVFCFMTAVVTLLVNDPVTREQRNTTVAVLGKGSSFGVSLYFRYLRKCPGNTMDQAHCFTVHACLSAEYQFQHCASIIFGIRRWHDLVFFPSYRNWPCFIIKLAVRQFYAKMKSHFWQFAERFVVW